MAEPQQRLDEIVIAKEFNVAEALSSIQFYWNLAKHRNQTIVVEIWAAKDKVVPDREEVIPSPGRQALAVG